MEVYQINRKRFTELRNQTRIGSGFMSVAVGQFQRPQVSMAWIRKTRIQTSVRTVELRGSELDQGLIFTHRTDPETELDQGKPVQERQAIETISKVRSRTIAGPLRNRLQVSETCRGEGLSRISSTSQERITKTKKRTKVPPSVFRGRGKLCLSITPEVGPLTIHIHRAKGLIGKSQRSCDSYMQVCQRRSYPMQVVGFSVGQELSPDWLYEFQDWFSLFKDEADLKGDPDLAPDRHLNHKTAATTTANLSNNNHSTTVGLKDLTTYSQTSSPNPIKNNDDCIPAKADCSSFVSTCYPRTNLVPTNSIQWLKVNIVRGKDGFGFTICSDCPVRIQDVDSGGPAHRSGLRQGDSVLQLNGLPVESWKCVDLAHAIRSCPSHIVLVVWRGLPDLRPDCEASLHPKTYSTTTGRKLLPHPSHSKHGCGRGQGFGVRPSLGALGSLWRDRKQEDQEEEVAEFSPCTHVTSSHGDNYIILSPVNTAGKLIQPVYHDRNGMIGRLYHTLPSRGQNLVQEPQATLSERLFNSRTSTFPALVSTSSSGLGSNYGNYQNCTIVQSHVPCSSYGTYTTMAPKTLIFPIFVQPLDLCSPDRTLLMAEELVLHQTDLLPAKATVLIYSDLLLLTREDEAGCYNVLQSPLYLNTLQLREVSSEPRLLYVLQRSSPSFCHHLFSLEAFTIEQKVRVSLCLHDNIQLQLVATEIGHTHQLSDFGLLSLHQSHLHHHSSSSSFEPPFILPSSDPLRSSSPSPVSPKSPPLFSLSPFTTFSSPLTHPPPSSSPPQRSPLWKERGGAEERVEERQQGEGESASETSENVGGVKGHDFHLSPAHLNMKEEEESERDEEEGGSTEEISFRPGGLRRSLSEGSLLLESRSTRFLSDSSIHRLTCPTTLDVDPVPHHASINTLRKQLTREGGTLSHMLLLLNGTKGSNVRNLQLKKKTKDLAADVWSHLPFLQRQKNSNYVHGNSLEKALRNNRPSPSEVLRWAESLQSLLINQYGLTVFRHFLRSEFSEENLDFWLAVETFKKTHPKSKMAARAAKIYDEFISTTAGRQVNVDSSVRESTSQNLCHGVNAASFQLAQDQIYNLMETDSYPRFLRSRLYTHLANQGSQTTTE